MLTRQCVQLSNAIRGHIVEYGLVAPVGRNGLQRLIAIIDDLDDARVPAVARASLAPLVRQLGLVNDQVRRTTDWFGRAPSPPSWVIA
jgi:transposase